MRGAQRLRELRLDAHHPRPVAQPRRLTGDEPAAAGGDDDRVEATDLILELARHRALPGDGVGVVERVHHQRAGLGLADVGRNLGLVVVAVDHSHRRPEAGDVGVLDRRRHRGHEHLGGDAECLRHVRHGGTVIAAAGGDEPCRRKFAGVVAFGQHSVRGTAGLERTGVLQQLQLEHEVAVVDHRRAAHQAFDASAGALHVVGRDAGVRS